ncbi:MAG: DM13 domain-containing protein [Deltaproteobacteria bacterium]
MAHGFGIGLLALLTVGAGAPLAAQQDQMQREGMQHGEMQHDEMQHDSMGMGQDAMAKDGMAMDHGMAMLPHGTFAPSGGHRVAGSFAVANEGDRTVLKLGSDFSVEGAPDLYVVLSAGDGLSPGAVFLGKLSKLSGAQTFEVPSGTRLRDFSHVVLWSRKDKVALGAASLAGGGGMMHK